MRIFYFSSELIFAEAWSVHSFLMLHYHKCASHSLSRSSFSLACVTIISNVLHFFYAFCGLCCVARILPTIKITLFYCYYLCHVWVEKPKESGRKSLLHRNYRAILDSSSSSIKWFRAACQNLSETSVLMSTWFVLAVNFKKTNNFFSLQKCPANWRLVVPSGLLSV